MRWDIIFEFAMAWRKSSALISAAAKQLVETNPSPELAIQGIPLGVFSPRWRSHNPATRRRLERQIADNLRDGNFLRARDILNAAIGASIPVTCAQQFGIYAGCGELNQAFMAYRNFGISKVLKRHLGEHLVQSLSQLSQMHNSAKLLVLASGGPGDEIRFASFYKKLLKRVSGRAAFTCDPRLLTMMARAFPDTEMIPVDRLHRLWDEGNRSKLKSARLLPSLSLYRVFDDRLWSKRKHYGGVLLATDALGDLIEEAHSFDGAPFLNAETTLVQDWRNRLLGRADKMLVGLCWRSAFLNKQRNVHYMDIDELTPIMETAGCKFVILQSQITGFERAWLHGRYSDRVVFFEDIDLFNDFEGLSALLANIDLLMAPATYIVELAGALGVKSLMLSNSTGNFYRRHPATKQDYWFSSIEHVEAANIGDKSGLIAEAAAKLRKSLEVMACHTRL